MESLLPGPTGLAVDSFIVPSISQHGQCNDSRESSPACGPACGPGPTVDAPLGPSLGPLSYGQWALAKKGPSRGNGEVLKRSRILTAYELSQDLQDKRIELLERKYGGVKARVAALTIQRAFRRYTLLKKFAAITAMAKAEKRLSRRLQTEGPGSPAAAHSPSTPSPRAQGHPQGLPQSPRAPPTRSLSMREHCLPRSQSTCCGPEHYEYCACAACGDACGVHDGSVTYWDSTTAHFYSPHEPYSEHDVPPDVPKRTSSITPLPGRLGVLAGDTGSITSVLSAGSDSSNHTTTASVGGEVGRPPSAQWTRLEHQDAATLAQSQLQGQMPPQAAQQPQQVVSPYGGHLQEPQHVMFKVSETVRKRQYRVGLNLFNKKPERGISYLIRRGFLENSPQGVARFLISRKGLSKQMIGEYLGNLQSPFNMAVLECFADELDLCGMAVDVGLRKFQSHFRMPGEAQKIERLMEVFSTRYCRCNQDVVARLRSPDTVFVLAFAIIMLNTDLHTPNIKTERRMKLDDFIKNLRGIDDCHDIDKDMLAGVYDRVKANEFKPGSDHVTQVMKVQSTIVGKKPNMALPHRRLVCYCRLYEVPDPYKKERPGVHQREVFLFNDLLVITKILSKKKNSVTYTFRQSFPLCGMMVTLFDVPYYPYGIRLSQRVDGKVLVTFNARNEHDRCKFAEDLRESVCEMDEMENLRIEAELERQKNSHAVRAARTNGAGSTAGSVSSNSENRDSGVADVEGVYACNTPENCAQAEREPCSVERERMAATDVSLKRSALSNSLLDIHEQFAGEKPQRRGSVGSLDSGMSISFQSTSASTVSRDSSPQNVQPSPGAVAKVGSKAPYHLQNHPHQVQQPLNHVLHVVHQAHSVHPGQPSHLGGMFVKRDQKVLRDENSPYSRSTEV